METPEFSNEFDVLYNNIMSNQAPGLDEYEKSVFLTKAQDEIIKNYFNPEGNKYKQGFDGSEKRQIDFSMLIVTTELQRYRGVGMHLARDLSESERFTLPSDLFVILNEDVETYNTKGNWDAENRLYDEFVATRVVVPISYTEYTRLLSKPFAKPLKRQVWRLISNVNNTDNQAVATLIAGVNEYPQVYYMRYLKRPDPIILTDLPDGLTIRGKSTVTECSLDPIIHSEILQRAVELAKIAYEGDVNQTQMHIQTGQRSE